MDSHTPAYTDPAITPFNDFSDVHTARGPSDRLQRARYAAAGVRERMMSAEPVAFYRSLDLIRVPYPTRFALREASRVKTPMLHIFNRMFFKRKRPMGFARFLSRHRILMQTVRPHILSD